jgi:hypothetical protein
MPSIVSIRESSRCTDGRHELSPAEPPTITGWHFDGGCVPSVRIPRAFNLSGLKYAIMHTASAKNVRYDNRGVRCLK